MSTMLFDIRLEAASKLPREVHLGIVTYASAGDRLLISNGLLRVKFHAVRSYRACSIVVILKDFKTQTRKTSGGKLPLRL